MKYYLLIFTLLFGGTSTFAQQYMVLNVKGNIQNVTQNKPILKGESLNAKDQIKFASSADLVMVMSADKGRFVLKPQTLSLAEKQSEFVTLVSKILEPGTGALTTRVVSLEMRNAENVITTGGVELATYFGKGKYIILDQAISLPLDGFQHEKLSKGQFALRYKYDGAQHEILLTMQSGSLILSPTEIFKEKHPHTTTHKISDCALFYKQDGKLEFQKIASFIPTFMTSHELKDNVDLYIKELKKDNKLTVDEIVDECILFLDDCCGRLDKDVFHKWYHKNYHN